MEFTSVEQELAYWKTLALTDETTKLLNRRAYNMDAASTPEYGIVYIDLNDLKVTNDSLGHDEGDRLLRKLSDCIREESDMAYRVGGDEFILILKNASLDVLPKIVSRMKEKLSQRNCRASFGFSHTSESINCCQLAEKRMYADKALYKASR